MSAWSHTTAAHKRVSITKINSAFSLRAATSSFPGTSTKSFQVASESSPEPFPTEVSSTMKLLSVPPSDLLGISQETRSVEYSHLLPVSPSGMTGPLYSVCSLYSALLFNGGALGASGFLASHVVQPFVAEARSSGPVPLDQKDLTPKLYINFPLRVMPSDADAKERMGCIVLIRGMGVLRFVKQDDKTTVAYEQLPIKNIQVDPNSRKYNATCVFEGKHVQMGKDATSGEIGGGFFYGVGWKDINDDQTLPARIRREAFDESDDDNTDLSELDPKYFVKPSSGFMVSTITILMLALNFSF